MSPEELARAVCRVAPETDPRAVLAFLVRLDEAYWGSHSPEEVALHLGMASSLSPTRPAAVAALPRDGGRADVVVVAYDYFAEFSLVCGLLATHALTIETGDVHTLLPLATLPRRGRSPHRAVTPSRQIVDVFRVLPRDPSRPPDAAALERELTTLLGLVATGRSDEAREQLTRRLAETLGAAPEARGAGLAPVEIDLDNEAAPPWTLMRVRGRDTPAFLYALANALAMRRVYIHRVRIESHGDEVRDEFLIARAEGGAIGGEAEQQTLRLAVALIKQFTHFLPWAPDPALALRYFDQFLDRVMTAGAGKEALSLLRGPEGLQALARLLGSSTFLWEDFFRAHFEHLGPVLGEWRKRPLEKRVVLRRRLSRRLASASTWEERKRILNELKDETMLRTSAKRLLDPEVSIEDFSRALTDLAEAVIEKALRECTKRLAGQHGPPRWEGRACPVAIFGLGKLGGAELGYASDVELLVIYGGPGTTAKTGIENGRFFDRAVQSLTELIEAPQDGFLHVDLRLRPHGTKGSLTTPFAALRNYYRPGGGAHPFERQALIKLRFVAGNALLGRKVEAFRDAYVWSDEPWNLAEALHLRDRQVRELVTPGRLNVKYSRGALVEVEYAAQYLQLLHGRASPELRTPSTLEALTRLRDAAFLDDAEHDDLQAAYLFWRQVIDALRMVRGNARDLLLPEEGSDDLDLLARRLGYAAGDWREGGRALAADAARQSARVATFFDRRFR
jgi:glutamate-ammonia-ligase adenylyltransferase